MITLSNVASTIEPSLIRKLFNMAKEMDDVVDFTLGDPDIQPHDNIKLAACDAINAGHTRYSQNAGLLDLRNAISRYYERKEGLRYNPLSEIAVTVGAMEGLYLTLLALINPSDEVIIPAPYYVNYKQMTQLCHGTPVIVTSRKGELIVDGEDIRHAVTPRTKAIIINTPSNPSGKIFSQETLKEIAKVAVEQNLVVISDEVYKTLIYGDTEFKSIVNYPDMRERTILVNSLSKEFCMTGYRIGYVLGPENIIQAIIKLQENVAACAPLPSQYAAIEALGNGDDYSANMRNVFTRRRDILVEGLKDLPGIRLESPQATFYAMIDISGLGYESSEEFAYDLLKNAKVALVPGIAYGDVCRQYVRLAFTLDESRIREGVKRIAEFINAKCKKA